jgi:hypothetical protein
LNPDPERATGREHDRHQLEEPIGGWYGTVQGAANPGVPGLRPLDAPRQVFDGCSTASNRGTVYIDRPRFKSDDGSDRPVIMNNRWCGYRLSADA